MVKRRHTGLFTVCCKLPQRMNTSYHPTIDTIDTVMYRYSSTTNNHVIMESSVIIILRSIILFDDRVKTVQLSLCERPSAVTIRRQ